MTHWRTAVLGMLLAALGGCATVPLPSGQSLSSGAPLRAAGKELTPAQAAEVSWAAAEELNKQGFEAEALGHYETVRLHDPLHAHLAWRLAVLHDRKGDASRAAAEYERALKGDPRNAALLNDAGYFHLQNGDPAQAEKHLKEAAALDAGNGRVSVNLGMALARQGKEQEALACFGRVLPPAQARCNMGVVLAQQGRMQEARHHLEEALRLDPALPQAKAFLVTLEQPAGQVAALPR